MDKSFMSNWLRKKFKELPFVLFMLKAKLPCCVLFRKEKYI